MGVIDELADTLPTDGDTQQTVAFATYAIIVYPVIIPSTFTGEKISAADFGGDDDSATIDIPSTLFTGLGNLLQPRRMVYGMFRNEALFTRRQAYLEASGRINNRLGSVVLSARITGVQIVTGLTDPVQIQFMKNPVCHTLMKLTTTLLLAWYLLQELRDSGNTEPSFWDQEKDEGYGAWSTEGCSLVSETFDQATCQCNHLTSFAIIVDISASPVPADTNLSPYTIVGSVLLLFFALVVLCSYIISRYVFYSVTCTTLVRLLQ